MIKIIFKAIKQVLLFLLILLSAYLIFLTLEDLNDLVFHSYKTKKVFWPFDNRHFFDLDLIVKYADHFWDIIAKSLVAIVLTFGAVIPYFTKLYRVIKTRFTRKNLSGDTEK
jgi:hypothetical protein